MGSRATGKLTSPQVVGIIGSGLGMVVLRMGTSLAWLNSAFIGKDAKLAPDFLSGAGLAERVTTTFVHTALTPGIADVLRNVVLPSAHLFAVLVAIGDLAVGISLAFGLFTRLGGFLGILRATTNILVVGGAGADTVGFNCMLILAGGLVMALGAGRLFGVDALLLTRYPDARFLRVLA